MCVLIFYFNPDETDPTKYKLIVLSIRDELFSRPTAAAHFWPNDENIIGGMDMEPNREGGSWLVFNKTGKLSALLNVFQPSAELLMGKKGRGFLAVDFAKSDCKQSPLDYIQNLYDHREDFNGFTLVCIDLKKSGSYMCNSSNVGVNSFAEGFHAFGNGKLPHQWPKVVAGHKLFKDIVEKHKGDEKRLEEEIFALMNSETNHGISEGMRQQTDEPDHLLLLRGSLKFYIPEFDYGSRTHTLILVRGDGRTTHVEKTVENGEWVERREEFHTDC